MIREVTGLPWTLTPQSTNVQAWHFDEATHELLVEFLQKKSGADRSVYSHKPVAPAFVARLSEPGISVGKMINDLRRDHSVSIERVEVLNASTDDAQVWMDTNGPADAEARKPYDVITETDEF